MRTRSLIVPALALAVLSGCADEPVDVDRDRETAVAATETPAPTAPPTAVPPTTSEPTTTEDGNVSYGTLQVGDCLDSEDIMGVVDDVTLLDCTEPHDAEVISSHEIAAPYPGEDAVLGLIETECVAFAQEWAGTDPARAGLSLGYLMPTSGDYARGVTNLLCVAIAPSSVTAPF